MAGLDPHKTTLKRRTERQVSDFFLYRGVRRAYRASGDLFPIVVYGEFLICVDVYRHLHALSFLFLLRRVVNTTVAGFSLFSF